MKLLKSKDFYVRSGLFSILSLAGALFNYALYPVLVRVLDSNSFGDFAAITALSNQIIGALSAFNIISIYLVKSQTERLARQYAQTIQKQLILFFLSVTALLLITSSYLHTLLKVQHTESFLLLAVILVLAVPSIVWVGYLQGNKELVRIGVYSLGASVAKFGLAIGLAIGFGTLGAIWGILGGAAAGLLILWALPGVQLPSIAAFFKKSNVDEKRFVRGLRGYIVECLLVVGALSFLQNYDILLAKALFDPGTAGLYSGVSILSNALYYVAFLLIWIMLPEINIGDRSNNRRVLLTAYKLLAMMGLLILAVEFIARDFLAQLLLGPSFSDQGMVLIVASLFQLSLVGVTLYAYYLLLNRKRRGTILGISVFIACVSLPALTAQTPLQMISYLWAALLAGLFVYLLLSKTYSLWTRTVK